MKSERRHELKQNTLAHRLETLPDVGRRHGTKILLIVMVGLVVALLIRSRVSSSRAAAQSAAHALNHGRELVEQLQVSSERVPATQFVSVAQEISKAVDTAVRQVLDSTDDPRMLAEARVLQGDLHWQLAAIPELPGATTRPELGLPRTDEQLLEMAATAYKAALDLKSSPRESVTSARLGLAAVAENRRQWDAAREHYQKVVDDGNTPQPLKDLAAASITRLETLRKPPLIAPPATLPSLESATMPATTRTSTAPAPSPPTSSNTAPTTSTTPASGANPQAATPEKTQDPKNPG